MAFKWWGYLHKNDSIQVKRFWSDNDIAEAATSPFVKKVYGPFDADGREDAISKVKTYIIEGA